MRFIIIAVVLTEVFVYGSVNGTQYAGTVQAAYEHPAMPIDPDDDEDDHRVRPRRQDAVRWQM